MNGEQNKKYTVKYMEIYNQESKYFILQDLF